MDPFDSISCELRLQVLESTSILDDMVRLSHASPALLQTRLAFDTHFEKQLFPRDLLQDATAVLLFPKKLKRYIDDYISKATSSQLCYAYTHLPKFSNRALTKGACLRPRPDSQLGFDDLSATEKYRLLKTFLRFELYSKLFLAGVFELGEYQGKPYQDKCSACSWSWGCLNKIEGTTLAAYESESFRCVVEYIRSLYAILMAYANGKLDHYEEYPTIGGESFYPDPWFHHSPAFWWDSIVPGIHNDYFSSRYFFRGRSHPGTLLGGFDQLDRLLRADMVEVFLDVNYRPLPQGHRHSHAFSQSEFECLDMGLFKHWGDYGIPDEPGVLTWLNTQNPWNYKDLNRYLPCSLAKLEDILGPVYRQRAWAFFDDKRHYTDQCEFPILIKLSEADRDRVGEKYEWRGLGGGRSAPYVFRQIPTGSHPQSIAGTGQRGIGHQKWRHLREDDR